MNGIKNLSKVPKSVALNRDLMMKQLNKSHTEVLFALTDQNRSYLNRWLPWVDSCISQSDTLNFITSANHGLLKNSGLTFGIFYKGKISGMISFNTIDLSDGKGEIGYLIGEAFQGLGLVTRACSKLIDIGFNQLDLKGHFIRCAIKNTKSQSIPIRLGFKKTEHVPKKEKSYQVMASTFG
ncbi:GNAT family N-acetyltransferase [Cardinium endosymbiont of Oedothorax gibbosus]|uniref:GNAT family N-acetyltransferase n=1 Tax=Cardinium endosymbiont of Oedothorax gibbosus TaxID=931101 RepID=UPI0020249D65|nr:GNAT family N-acetyltransferase [Cardinium endosymbiont of Oedothorax gibbosus]